VKRSMIVIVAAALLLVMSSVVACQAVALCEGLETSLIDRRRELEIPRLRSE